MGHSAYNNMLDIKLMREICLNIFNKLLYWFNNYKDDILLVNVYVCHISEIIKKKFTFCTLYIRNILE